jgi:hypothetical protein
MRLSSLLTGVVIAATLATAPQLVAADSRAVRKAVARAHPTGGDAVYAGRRLLWRGHSKREQVVSKIRWSRTRDALAFATTDRLGVLKLVVVLVGGDTDGHVMTWPIPVSSAPSATPTVTWLGQRRVAFGRSQVRPDVVASWRVRQ